MNQALLGCAIGDSWGYPYEFMQSTPATEVYFPKEVGESELVISDDTQMTLASLKATQDILAHGDFSDLTNTRKKYEEEYIKYNFDEDNYRASGTTVTASLERLANHLLLGNDYLPALESSGCGSIMRFSPSAILAPTEYSVSTTVMQALITHDSDSSIATASLASAIIKYFRELEDIDNITDISLIDIATSIMTGEMFSLIESDKNLLEEEIYAISDSLVNSNTRISSALSLQPNYVYLEEAIYNSQKYAEEIVHAIEQGGESFDELADSYTYIDAMGTGWDSASCFSVSLLLAEVFRMLIKNGMSPKYATYRVMKLSVGWKGDRDSRGAVTGALVGALYPDIVEFKELLDERRLTFEGRYNDAIMNTYWNGFDEVNKNDLIFPSHYKTFTNVKKTQ